MIHTKKFQPMYFDVTLYKEQIQEILNVINTNIFQLQQKTITLNSIIPERLTERKDVKILLKKISTSLSKLEDLNHIIYIGNNITDSICKDI